MIVFAREPIFDKCQHLFAYQLVFRDGEQGALPADLTADSDDQSIASSAKNRVDLDELLSGFISVVSITKRTVLQGLPAEFTPEDTILEIANIKDSDASLIDAIVGLRQQGFRISIENNQPLTKLSLSLADYLKFDINRISLNALKQLQADVTEHKIKTIATNVETPAQYQKCLDAGFDYFQGYFFLTRQHANKSELPANKLSLLQLLAQTADTRIDMDQIRKTFEHDATLSYLLMRFINNPLINKSIKITSIKHALTYLGEMMLRKFAAIVSIAQLNQDNVQELLQVSLVRAKYCELLDTESVDSKDAMSAFMAGLFSLIDIILDRDMDKLLSQIPLSIEINQALLQQTGPYHLMLASVRALESSSWLQFKECARGLGIAQETLHAHYVAAVRWNNALNQSPSDMFPQARPNGQ
jgi:EAL and modified HD-GYP domain-containing signal transduction protein